MSNPVWRFLSRPLDDASALAQATDVVTYPSRYRSLIQASGGWGTFSRKGREEAAAHLGAGFFTSAGLDARKGFDGPGYGTAYMLCGGGLRIRLTGLPVTVWPSVRYITGCCPLGLPRRLADALYGGFRSEVLGH